jgi:hypothetical protein
VESPVVESPVVESPVVESPVVESPVVESPVVESPVVELLVVELLVAESPMVELLVAVELPLPVLALNNLQAASIPSQPLTSIDPQSLKQQSHQQLVNFKQENQHQVNATDGQTIDVVSMLFDFFFDDEALPDPIKVLIGRLQIPMLKVAIIDKDFFNQKKHPARKLLDSISRASLGWSEGHTDEQPLIDKTEEIVNFLITEFDEDISVFEEAYISFENFLTDQSQEIEKVEKEIQQQEQDKDIQIQQAQDAVAG